MLAQVSQACWRAKADSVSRALMFTLQKEMKAVIGLPIDLTACDCSEGQSLNFL